MKELFKGTYTLPELDEGQHYSCYHCGECEKTLVEQDVMTKHCEKDLELIERHYVKTEMSKCCHAGIEIVDNETGEPIDHDLVFALPSGSV